MKLYAVRIFVDDYAAARRFYVETLGLPVAWEMADHGMIGVDAGGPQLIVEEQALEDPHPEWIGRFVGVSLEVDDIEQTAADLEAKGVIFSSPPERQFWGGRLAHFKDPAGNTLSLLGR